MAFCIGGGTTIIKILFQKYVRATSLYFREVFTTLNYVKVFRNFACNYKHQFVDTNGW